MSKFVKEKDESVSASFRVLILGPFIVERDGADLDAACWPGRSAGLLKLLATAPGHRLSRDEIADQLWPEAMSEAGRSNVRYTVHLLRRALGGLDPPPVLSSHGWIWLNPAYCWDIDLEALDRDGGGEEDIPRLEEAASLFRGEPLIENRYDDWAAPIRRQLQRRWRDLCLHLGCLHRSSGTPERSVFWLRRALDADPADEDVLEELLRSLVAGQRFAEAVRVYSDYETYIRDELGVAPGPRVQSLIARLPGAGADRVAKSRVPGASGKARPVLPRCLPLNRTIFVAREAELDQTLDWLEREEERPQLRLLAGATGVGKTRILAEAAARARGRGVLTLAGRCYQQEGRIPYGPFHDALAEYIETQPDSLVRAQLDGLPGVLGEVIPEVRNVLQTEDMSPSGDAADRRLSVFVAVSDLIERLTRSQPVALLFDDLQWADERSLQLLHFLQRRDRLRGLHLIAAFRTDEPSPDSTPMSVSSSLPEMLGARIIPVTPFSRSAVATLCESHLGDPCSEGLLSVLERKSGGNAFFLLQLLAVLRNQEGLTRSNGVWTLRAGAAVTLPRAVREVVERRLGFLDPAERTVLRLGSVLGQEWPFASLEALWTGDGDLFAALDRLTSVGLLHETGDGYAFSHAMLRETVYDSLTTHGRKRLHRRAGAALERLYGADAWSHAALLAQHFVQGDDPARALLLLVRAGEQADAAGAYDTAAGYYRTAIELTRRVHPVDARSLADLLLKAGTALRMTAGNEEAVAMLVEAASIAETLGDALGGSRALVNMAKAYVRSGKGDAALQPLARAEALLERSDLGLPGPELSSIYGELGNLYFRMGRYQELLAARERQIDIARAMGDERTLVRAEVGRALAVGMLGQFREAGRQVEEIIPRAEALDDAETLRLALGLAAESAMVAGSFRESRGYREREIEVAEQLQGTGIRPFSMSNLAQLLLYLGEWKRAREAASDAIEQLLAIGSASRAVYPRTFLGELALREGRFGDARCQLEECVRVAGQIGDLQAQRYAARLLAELDLGCGLPRNAMGRLTPLLDRAHLTEHDVTPLLATLAWAYLEEGQTDRAANVAAEALSRAEAEQNRLAEVEIYRVQGMIRARNAEWTEAQHAFRASERLAREMPYPYAVARALYQHGMAALNQSECRQAEKNLCRAQVIFHRLGASRDVEQIEQALAGTPSRPTA